jgi:IS4 transposase
LVLLTNRREVRAEIVAALYKKRWQIEMLLCLRSSLWAACGSLSRVARLFLRINQHLRIKHFFGTSPDAVRNLVWIAVSACVLIAMLHRELKLPGTLLRPLQIFSVHSFEKIPLHQRRTKTPSSFMHTHDPDKLWLW